MSKRIKNIPKGYQVLPLDLKWELLNYIGMRVYVRREKPKWIGWIKDKPIQPNQSTRLRYIHRTIFLWRYVTENQPIHNLTKKETRIIRWPSVETIHLHNGVFIETARDDYISEIFTIPLAPRSLVTVGKSFRSVGGYIIHSPISFGTKPSILKFYNLQKLSLINAEVPFNTLPMPRLQKLLATGSFIPNSFFKKHVTKKKKVDGKTIFLQGHFHPELRILKFQDAWLWDKISVVGGLNAYLISENIYGTSWVVHPKVHTLSLSRPVRYNEEILGNPIFPTVPTISEDIFINGIFPSLKRLDIEGHSYMFSGKEWRPLIHLKILFLDDILNMAGGAFIKNPSIFPNLEELIIENDSLRSYDAMRIKTSALWNTFPKLKIVEFSYVNGLLFKIDDLFSKRIRKESGFCPNVERLVFIGIRNHLTGGSWYPLDELKSIDIESCQDWTDIFFQQQKFTKLEYLTLNNLSHVTGKHWNFPKLLKTLILHDVVNFEDHFFRFHNFFNELLILEIENITKIEGKWNHAQFSNLETLLITNCINFQDLPFKQGSFQNLKFMGFFKCPKLTGKEYKGLFTILKFRVQDCVNFEDKFFSFESGPPGFAQNLWNIKQLTVEKCPKITGKLWAPMKELVQLNLWNLPNFHGRWFILKLFNHMHHRRALGNLKHLRLWNCPLITGENWKSFPKLEILGIDHCQEIRDIFFLNSDKFFPSLKELALIGLPHITGENWKGLNKLKTLIIRNCQHFKDTFFKQRNVGIFSQMHSLTLKFLPLVRFPVDLSKYPNLIVSGIFNHTGFELNHELRLKADEGRGLEFGSMLPLSSVSGGWNPWHEKGGRRFSITQEDIQNQYTVLPYPGEEKVWAFSGKLGFHIVDRPESEDEDEGEDTEGIDTEEEEDEDEENLMFPGEGVD